LTRLATIRISSEEEGIAIEDRSGVFVCGYHTMTHTRRMRGLSIKNP
jgi:hypothetical protein